MPAGIVIIILEVPDPVIEIGFKVAQLDEDSSVTVLVKPLRALMVIVEVIWPPVVGTIKIDGLPEIVKSGVETGACAVMSYDRMKLLSASVSY